MKQFKTPILLQFARGLLLILAATSCITSCDSNGDTTQPVDTQDNTAQSDNTETKAMIFESPDGFAQFTVTGVNDDFGRYLAYGEVNLVEGEEEGVQLVGMGAGVVQASNDDQIVADVTCEITDGGLNFTFHWRDSVDLSTGSTVDTTGDFVDNRPPGLSLSSLRGNLFEDHSRLTCKPCMYTECGEFGCKAQCLTCCVPDSQTVNPCTITAN